MLSVKVLGLRSSESVSVWGKEGAGAARATAAALSLRAQPLAPAYQRGRRHTAKAPSGEVGGSPRRDVHRAGALQASDQLSVGQLLFRQ